MKAKIIAATLFLVAILTSGAARAQTQCTSSNPCLFYENLSTGNGIRGKSDQGIGVGGDGLTWGLFGSSVNGQGVGGTSTNATGGIFTSDNSDGAQTLAKGSSGSGIWTRCTGSGCWGMTSSGNVYVVGTVYQTSDLRAKLNVQSMPSLVSEKIILAAQPRTFTWINSTVGGDANGDDMGLIAQEVQKYLPTAVKLNEKTDLLGVNYGAFTVHLIQFAQDEHKARLASDAKLASVESRLSALEDAVGQPAVGSGGGCSATGGRVSLASFLGIGVVLVGALGLRRRRRA